MTTENQPAPGPADKSDDGEERRTPAQLQALADTLRAQLEAGLSQEWDLLERPYALAGLFGRLPQPSLEVQCFDFEETIDAFIGMRTAELIAPYLQLHAELVARGHTSAQARYEFRNDGYLWAAADRVAPKKDLGINFRALLGIEEDESEADKQAAACARQMKAIVLETQSSSYLLLLNYEFGRWSQLHVRQFWPSLEADLASGRGLLNLDAVRDRTDLTVMDLVALSSRACAYSDALPGVAYPERPSLATLLDGSLLPGEEDAGIALRYGDFRDRGYVLSVTRDRDGEGQVKKMVHSRISTVTYVASNMAIAIEGLEPQSDQD
jgi:hypothetical protein